MFSREEHLRGAFGALDVVVAVHERGHGARERALGLAPFGVLRRRLRERARSRRVDMKVKNFR